MKGLAEFVMRSRLRALLLVLAGAGSLMFCWISAAVVALVTLRKGVGEGGWLLLWGLLPAGALVLALGDSGPLSLLLGTALLALVLRQTVSLALAVLMTVPVGLLTGLSLVVFGGEMLEQIVAMFSEFLAGMERRLSTDAAQPVVLVRPTPGQVAGMLGTGNAVLSALCLLLGRYWQAALYNPGGFGEEFRRLFLPRTWATGLALVGFGLALTGPELRSWGMIFLVPLTFSGMALVHSRLHWHGQGSGWLTGFYLVWVVFDPVKLMVVLIAVADSWQNFRQRWSRGSGGDDGGDRE